jgi:hypothetical protein
MWRVKSPGASTHVLGDDTTPQRLALARRPAIRYDTLPDVRWPLVPPGGPAFVRRPQRHCVQSLPER